MPPQHHELRLPVLGLGEIPITVCCWLVPQGGHVIEGDRVVQLLAGEVTVDLSAPVTGKLIRRQVEEDEQAAEGQILGVIRVES